MKKRFIALILCIIGISIVLSGCSRQNDASILNTNTTILSTHIVRAQNQCPEIPESTFSDSEIGGGEQVRLAVTATDIEQSQLFYVWTPPTQGIFQGQGPQAVWTAATCDEVGQLTKSYEIVVEVSDGQCSTRQVFPIAVNCGGRPGGQQPDVVIAFAAGQTALDAAAKSQLDAIAAAFTQSPEATLIIEGHTDATGNENANQQIGLKRAERVKQYLAAQHKIDPQRMSTVSYGSTRPIASNDTQAGRDQNRRVEIYRR